MSSLSPRFRVPRGALLRLAPLIVWLGCGGDDGETGVEVPALEVRTRTTGVELDPDGYAIRLDGSAARVIGITDTLFIDPLTDGSHSVLLEGLADNCTLGGDNPRSVSTAQGRTEVVTFAVICSPTAGAVVVTTTIGGETPDPDGYTLLLDGGEEGPIGVAAQDTLADLSPGEHQVGLNGVAGNCTVAGSNPRTVEVVAGDTVPVSFAVTCVPPPPAMGGLRVRTATSGPSPDPDGYTLSLDGGTGQPMGSTDTLLVSPLSAAAHTVALTGVAANCSVEGDNPRTVTVVPGDTAEVAFTVRCAATAGAIAVGTETTGEDLDPDGYRVRVDEATGQAIGLSDTLVITGLAPGSHRVRLAQVAANCTIAGENPRIVEVTAGETAAVGFAVTCTATRGSIMVTASTTGERIDPDGFSVRVDGGTAHPIGVNDTLTLTSLTPGPHTVALADLASGCTVQGENPRTVSVVAADTATATFSVTCSPPGVKNWTLMTSGTTDQLGAIWGSSAADIYVGARYSDRLLHYDGTSWSSRQAPGRVWSLWVNSPTDVFASVYKAGHGTALYRYDGRQWSEMIGPPAPPRSDPDAPPTPDLDVWGLSGTDVYAYGLWMDPYHDAYLSHYDGTAWSLWEFPGLSSNGVTDVWASAANDVFALAVSCYDDAVGSWPCSSTLYHFDGSGWSTALRDDLALLSHLWGSSPSDVYAVGTADYDDEPSTPMDGAIWHFDGASWSASQLPSSGGALGPIWGSAADDVYLIAGGREIWHFDGVRWRLLYTSATSLSGIWGSSASDVFVTGADGTILHGTP